MREAGSASLALDERAVIGFAEWITLEPGSVTDEDIRQLKEWFGEADLVELNLLIGATNLTCRFKRCFAIELQPQLR